MFLFSDEQKKETIKRFKGTSRGPRHSAYKTKAKPRHGTVAEQLRTRSQQSVKTVQDGEGITYTKVSTCLNDSVTDPENITDQHEQSIEPDQDAMDSNDLQAVQNENCAENVLEHELVIVSGDEEIASCELFASTMDNNGEYCQTNELGEDVYEEIDIDETIDLDENDEPNNESQNMDFDENLGKLPLYQDADISIQETLVLIMTLSRRHSMSDVALEHWLKFLAIILPINHKLPTKVSEVKGYFTTLNRDVKHIYYCSQCHESNEIYMDVCASCGERIEKNDYFVALNIEKQIKDILEGMFD